MYTYQHQRRVRAFRELDDLILIRVVSSGNLQSLVLDVNRH